MVVCCFYIGRKKMISDSGDNMRIEILKCFLCVRSCVLCNEFYMGGFCYCLGY